MERVVLAIHMWVTSVALMGQCQLAFWAWLMSVPESGGGLLE